MLILEYLAKTLTEEEKMKMIKMESNDELENIQTDLTITLREDTMPTPQLDVEMLKTSKGAVEKLELEMAETAIVGQVIQECRLAQPSNMQEEVPNEVETPSVSFPARREAPTGMELKKPPDWEPMQTPMLRLPPLSEKQLHWMAGSCQRLPDHEN